MSDTGSHAQDGKTIKTQIMDRYSATEEALGYYNRVYKDKSEEHRYAIVEKVNLQDNVEETIAEIRKVETDLVKLNKHDKEKAICHGEAAYAHGTLKQLNKRLERQEKDLRMHEKGTLGVEKKRWDAFVSITTLTEKKDELLKEGLALHKKDLKRKNEFDRCSEEEDSD